MIVYKFIIIYFFLGPFGPRFLAIVPFLLSLRSGWLWLILAGLKKEEFGYCVNENWSDELEFELCASK